MEEWKYIEFDNRYKISDYGNVYSDVNNIYLKKRLKKSGYYSIVIKKKEYTIHQLVWDHFGSGKRNGHKIQVDHKDENKLNNHIDNLQLLSNRENVIKSLDKTNSYSRYIGVTKWKDKWLSKIWVDGKTKNLGYFETELDASNTYQEAVKKYFS